MKVALSRNSCEVSRRSLRDLLDHRRCGSSLRSRTYASRSGSPVIRRPECALYFRLIEMSTAVNGSS